VTVQRIFLFDEVEQSAAEHRTILDVHCAVRALRHDLERLHMATQQAQAHEPEPGRFHGRLDDRLQMGHGSDQTAETPNATNGLPERRSFRTATQQYVLLSGMAAMYAPKGGISSRGRDLLRFRWLGSRTGMDRGALAQADCDFLALHGWRRGIRDDLD